MDARPGPSRTQRPPWRPTELTFVFQSFQASRHKCPGSRKKIVQPRANGFDNTLPIDQLIVSQSLSFLPSKHRAATIHRKSDSRYKVVSRKRQLPGQYSPACLPVLPAWTRSPGGVPHPACQAKSTGPGIMQFTRIAGLRSPTRQREFESWSGWLPWKPGSRIIQVGPSRPVPRRIMFPPSGCRTITRPAFWQRNVPSMFTSKLSRIWPCSSEPLACIGGRTI